MLRNATSDTDGLVAISREGVMDVSSPTISFEEYQAWTHRAQSLFADFAFYRPVRRGSVGDLSLAVASENLPDLLNVRVPPLVLESARKAHAPVLVVTESAWHRHFAPIGRGVGEMVDVAGQRAVVAAVVPDDRWPLGDRMDGWLLEDDRHRATLPAASLGFVVGRMSAKALREEGRKRWHMSVSHDGVYDGYKCIPLSDFAGQPMATFLFTLLLACLALPATTPLPLGDYPAGNASLAGFGRWRRWGFLLMKIGFAVPIVYCGSLGAAYLVPSASAATSQYLLLATSFAGLLFSFRWALRDQRRRCPVCLRLLSNPARVGHPSRNFLAWHGTEFICGEGHGLLHVPEIATTWFGTQRWLSLDPSWQGLFGEPLPSPGLF